MSATFHANDPTYCAQKYDATADRVLVLRLSEADYKSASFLDDRIIAPEMEGFWTSLAEFGTHLNAAGRPLHFIFHPGHAGSTLLSRLLAETAAVLPLREPLPLRTLAELHDGLGSPHALLDADGYSERLETFLRAWSRGFPTTEAVILKATSTAGRIATVLLNVRPEARAVYLNLAAEPYLATQLAGANAMVDLKGHAPERNRRLERALGEAPMVLHRASIGELAALAWIAEKLAERAAAGPRVMAVDFEAMLAATEVTLARIAAHFGVPAPSAATISQVMSRYSKGPEHAYSPALRTQLLAQARHEHADELRKGLNWIEATAKRHGIIARALG